MPKIFIDSNKYLDFYRIVSIDRLLSTLVQLAPNIFISAQIVNEFNRNKVETMRSLSRELKSWFEFDKFHIVPDDNYEKDLLVNLHGIQKTQGELREKVIKSLERYESNVIESKDAIFSKLSVIFKNAQAATPEQIARARLRKELGNPPGKRGDPLGDQLNWEQFLDEIRSEKEIWIISSDNDYFVDFKGQTLLNPVLDSDVKRVAGERTKIKCYKLLSNALNDYQKLYPTKGFPKDEQLRLIADDEEKLVNESAAHRLGINKELSGLEKEFIDYVLRGGNLKEIAKKYQFDFVARSKNTCRICKEWGTAWVANFSKDEGSLHLRYCTSCKDFDSTVTI